MLKFYLLLLLAFEAKGHRIKRMYNGEDDLNVPYYVRLVENDNPRFRCGGAIISKDWILTAAHCLIEKEKIDIQVITGAKQKIDDVTFHQIENFIMHEYFSMVTTENDIALIKLKNSLKFDENQSFIKIRKEPLSKKDKELKFSGMGKINEHGDDPKVVQLAVLPVVDRETCQKQYYPDKENDYLYENMFCLGSKKSHTCTGDSGGPAVDLNSGELVGILSWGPIDHEKFYGCRIHGPTVFTKVIAYRDWIEKETGLNLNYVEYRRQE